MRQIILDTETTGLSFTNDVIIEIACVEIKNKIPTGTVFHSFINNENTPISQEAYQVHNISAEAIKDAPKFRDVFEKILEFIDSSPIVAHNASFDINMLNGALQRIGEKTIKNTVVDTLKIARRKFPGSDNSLNGLCKRFNISIENREKHSALEDCNLLASVYYNLMGKYIIDSENTESKNKTSDKIDLSKIPS